MLTTVAPLAFSANLTLQPGNGSTKQLIFPVVQGMGYVTGVYSNLQPLIQSSVFFRSVVSAGSPKPGIYKYRVTLEDSKSWLLYVTPSNGA
ncbi:hypothetical protein, partial [Halalkalibacter flavus]|uniref:hypothetical protein n=1 Tax=Halalkalibacter flavus TaxID=3090668 RepID=UPI003D673D63